MPLFILYRSSGKNLFGTGYTVIKFLEFFAITYIFLLYTFNLAPFLERLVRYLNTRRRKESVGAKMVQKI